MFLTGLTGLIQTDRANLWVDSVKTINRDFILALLKRFQETVDAFEEILQSVNCCLDYWTG